MCQNMHEIHSIRCVWPDTYFARLQTWLDHSFHCYMKPASLPHPQEQHPSGQMCLFSVYIMFIKGLRLLKNAHSVLSLERSWHPHLSVAGAEAKGKAHGCPDKCAKDNQDYSVDHVAQNAHEGDTNCLHSKSTQTGIRDAHLQKAATGSTMCEHMQWQVLHRR